MLERMQRLTFDEEVRKVRQEAASEDISNSIALMIGVHSGE